MVLGDFLIFFGRFCGMMYTVQMKVYGKKYMDSKFSNHRQASPLSGRCATLPGTSPGSAAMMPHADSCVMSSGCRSEGGVWTGEAGR